MRLEVLAAVCMAVFGLACLSPALGAQFVLVDDHEIISYTQAGQGPPLDGLGIMVLSSDPAVGRFRPMYWLTRLTEISVLRDDPTAWHALALALGGATAVLLYATARALRFRRTLAVLFGAWVLVAPGVSSVWVRLGPNETFGMLFMTIAAFCAVKAGRTRQRLAGVAWDTGFVLTAIATFLSKESLILIAPALTGLRLLASQKDTQTRKLTSALLVLVIGGGLAFTAAAIGRAAGTQSNEGDFLAAPDVRADIVRFAHNLAILVFAGSGWLLLLLVPRARCWLANGPQLKRAGLVALLAGLLIVPQLMLYSNVGILEGRYELPAALGVIGLVLAGLRVLDEQRARNVYRVGVGVLTSTLVVFGFSSWTYASYFAADSHELQELLQGVSSQTPAGDVIGIAGDPARQYEPILSMATYLGRFGRGEDEVKLLPLEPLAPPYSPGELSLVHAIDGTPVMASPTLEQIGCNRLGALVVMRDDPRIEQKLPCVGSGYRRETYSARVLVWGGDVVSLRPRLPGFATVSYTALIAP